MRPEGSGRVLSVDPPAMPGDVIQGPWPQRPEGAENHPAGRQRTWPPNGWKRGGLAGMSTTEDRRAAILGAKPRCKVCEVPFDTRRAEPPPDLICRPCRKDLDRNTEADDPALF